MTPISAVIITFNEERNIERCLLSLKNVVDDIVVLDSFSTDRTKEICEKFAVQFVQDDWKGYAATKNNANLLAQNDFILSIDADEALSQNLQAAIRELKKNDFVGVYSMNRMTNYCGQWIKYSGWYPDKKIRIFPKSKVFWQGEWVHETLAVPESLPLTHIKGDIEHYSYYSFKEHREKADHYSRLTAQKMHERGKKAYILSPYLSGMVRFFTMFFLKLGFLDGYKGFKIAQISAASNVFKYKELIRHRKNA
jgi:(heptosyl)LPS beta-1,4-glucosyltransferase